jgi:hypothetical protein
MVTGNVYDDQASIPGCGSNFSVHYHIQTGSGAHPTFFCPRGSGVKRPEREVVHSPPYAVEVKNTWNYISDLP